MRGLLITAIAASLAVAAAAAVALFVIFSPRMTVAPNAVLIGVVVAIVILAMALAILAAAANRRIGGLDERRSDPF